MILMWRTSNDDVQSSRCESLVRMLLVLYRASFMKFCINSTGEINKVGNVRLLDSQFIFVDCK
jgi:hypothetical protein